jgi:plastocyanin
MPRTAIRALVALICSAVPLAAQGVVSGRVTLQEKPGTPTKDLETAVVWLTPVNGTAPKPAAIKAEIGMLSRTFTPHVQVVPVGSTVSFPNKDPFSHNIFSTTVGSAFDLGLYGKGQTKDRIFGAVGAVPVYCNIHAKMTAWVVSVPTPWYAQPSADGRWTIRGVPAGTYNMHVWHERAAQQVKPISVLANGMVAADIQLDARGYVFVQHRDKRGVDYNAPGRDRY